MKGEKEMLEASKKLVEVVNEVVDEVMKESFSVSDIANMDTETLKHMQLLAKLLNATNTIITEQAKTLDSIENKIDQVRIKLDLLEMNQRS